MELQSTMAILALCLLTCQLAEAGMRHPRHEQKPRRAPKSQSTSSTTTPRPDGGADARPESEIRYDPIEVRYQVHRYPHPSGGGDNRQAGRSPQSQLQQQVNLPQQQVNLQQQQVHLPQQQVNLPQQQLDLQQQQVHMQQPLLHLPAATPQLHPFHQQQIIQMIQRALYATQRHNQPTAMIIIAQPAAQPPQSQSGPYAGQTQPLLNYYQQGDQQGKYQLVQEPAPQQLHQYIAESTLPHPPPPNFQIIPASALQYQPDFAVPVQMPTTHMSPVQPQQLSQIASHAHLAAQQVPSQAQQYPNPAQQYASPAQEYLSPAQAQAYTRHASEHFGPASSGSTNLGSAHQFQFEAGSRATGQSGVDSRGGVPVRSLPPIITGFENFSPEQQEKIKEQLSAHFGAPLKLLAEQHDRGQYATNSEGGFVPSQRVEEGRGARGGSSIMNLTKNKSQKM